MTSPPPTYDVAIAKTWQVCYDQNILALIVFLFLPEISRLLPGKKKNYPIFGEKRVRSFAQTTMREGNGR